MSLADLSLFLTPIGALAIGAFVFYLNEREVRNIRRREAEADEWSKA